MSEAPLEYYELQKVTIEPTKPGEFRLVTAAVLSCELCNATICGNGGPGTGPICVRCAEVVMSGRARGAIKWSDAS